MVEPFLSNMYVALGSILITTSKRERREEEEKEKECSE